MSSLSRGTKAELFSILPAGVVLPYAGAVAPDGWAFCDGTTASRSEFPELFLALGTAHGEGDGSTTFHLPDYRGRFMRGLDNGAGRDPDSGSRTAANAGGNAGDNVGSVEGEDTAPNGMFANTTGSQHGHNAFAGLSNTGGGHVRPSSSVTGNADQNITASIKSTGSDHSHGITGGNETRPVNANVNYIIKL